MSEIVVPTLGPLVKAPYVDDDVARYGEVPSAKELEIRVADAVVGAGTLVERRLSVVETLLPIRQDERVGEQLHGLDSATGWTADADVSASVYATTPPSGYAGDSLAVVASGGSSGDRGAHYDWASAKDLSEYGGGALLRLQRRVTSVTNLTGWKLRLGNGTWYWEWEVVGATDAIDTWEEVALALQGYAYSGSPAWSGISRLELIADVSGAYTGSLYVRDLRLGTVQTAKSTPDGHLVAESSYDLRVHYRDDVDARESSTLAAAADAGATTIKHTSGSWVVGDQLEITSVIGLSEVRTITSVGTAGAGGEGLTLDEALTHAHASGEAIEARHFGPWSSWRTIKASLPPVVAASSPADAATIADPTPDLVHTFSSPGSKSQARVVTRVYERDTDDALIWTGTDTGTELTRTVPRLLLEDGKTYAWEKEAFDSDGLSTSTNRRSFDLSVGSIDDITNLVATPVPEIGAVTLAWDASTETYLDHYRVYWRDDAGSWVRVDGGPEGIEDGRVPITTPAFTHYGARLGLNEYAVTAHVGAADTGTAESELDAATADATLDSLEVETWVLVAEGVEPIEIRADRAPSQQAAIVNRFDPPGRGTSIHHSFAVGAQTYSLEATHLPETDGDVSRRLEALIGSRAWLKAPAGWLQEPWYCIVVSVGSEPQAGGLIKSRIALERTSD